MRDFIRDSLLISEHKWNGIIDRQQINGRQLKKNKELFFLKQKKSIHAYIFSTEETVAFLCNTANYL